MQPRQQSPDTPLPPLILSTAGRRCRLRRRAGTPAAPTMSSAWLARRSPASRGSCSAPRAAAPTASRSGRPIFLELRSTWTDREGSTVRRGFREPRLSSARGMRRRGRQRLGEERIAVATITPALPICTPTMYRGCNGQNMNIRPISYLDPKIHFSVFRVPYSTNSVREARKKMTSSGLFYWHIL